MTFSSIHLKHREPQSELNSHEAPLHTCNTFQRSREHCYALVVHNLSRNSNVQSLHCVHAWKYSLNSPYNRDRIPIKPSMVVQETIPLSHSHTRTFCKFEILLSYSIYLSYSC